MEPAASSLLTSGTVYCLSGTARGSKPAMKAEVSRTIALLFVGFYPPEDGEGCSGIHLALEYIASPKLNRSSPQQENSILPFTPKIRNVKPPILRY